MSLLLIRTQPNGKKTDRDESSQDEEASSQNKEAPRGKKSHACGKEKENLNFFLASNELFSNFGSSFLLENFLQFCFFCIVIPGLSVAKTAT